MTEFLQYLDNYLVAFFKVGLIDYWERTKLKPFLVSVKNGCLDDTTITGLLIFL